MTFQLVYIIFYKGYSDGIERIDSIWNDEEMAARYFDKSQEQHKAEGRNPSELSFKTFVMNTKSMQVQKEACNLAKN